MAAVTGFGSNPPCLAAKSGLFAGEVRINLNYSFSILFKYFHCVWIFKDHESCSLEAAATVCCHFFSLFPSKEPLCCYGLTWNIDRAKVCRVSIPESRYSAGQEEERRWRGGCGELHTTSCDSTIDQTFIFSSSFFHSLYFSSLLLFISFAILCIYQGHLPSCLLLNDSTVFFLPIYNAEKNHRHIKCVRESL